MRFCSMERNSQEDDFPPGMTVKVGNKQCALPKPPPKNKRDVEPIRPPGPVNIISQIKLSSTTTKTINVQWLHDYGRAYAIAITVALGHKHASDLHARLKSRGAKDADITRGLIKQKLNEDADNEISTTSLLVSLMCPLGKTRMSSPCRAKTCDHLQCFDAYLYLRMNERKATWTCPVCDKPALYKDLYIDGYFQDVLNSPDVGSDIEEIQVHKDGSWSVPKEVKVAKSLMETTSLDNFIEIIDDDEPSSNTTSSADSSVSETEEETEADDDESSYTTISSTESTESKKEEKTEADDDESSYTTASSTSTDSTSTDSTSTDSTVSETEEETEVHDDESSSNSTSSTESSESETEAQQHPMSDLGKIVVDLTLSGSEDDESSAKRRAVMAKPDSTNKFSDEPSYATSSTESTEPDTQEETEANRQFPTSDREKRVIDLTLSSSEDDEPPVKRRAVMTQADSTNKF